MYNIFTVTTVRDPIKCNHPTGYPRTVGWFSQYETAHDCVSENWGDIYEEGYYRFAVIEEFPSGIYQHRINEWWYEWDIDQGKYILLKETPDYFFQIANFGIG